MHSPRKAKAVIVSRRKARSIKPPRSVFRNRAVSNGDIIAMMQGMIVEKVPS